MTHVKAEIASQPDCWRQAAKLFDSPGLPARDERVAVVGCGTSWFIGQAYAALRERAGQGETDAFQASEFPRGRRYDRVVAITRSGTTTEVVELLQDLTVPATVLTADPAQPAAALARDAVVLDFADEQAVVQTRFATSALALLRAHLGEGIDPIAADAEVEATGASFVHSRHHGGYAALGSWCGGRAPLDPMADLVVAQRVAVLLATSQGLDPDRPRHLSRSVVLT